MSFGQSHQGENHKRGLLGARWSASDDYVARPAIDIPEIVEPTVQEPATPALLENNVDQDHGSQASRDGFGACIVAFLWALAALIVNPVIWIWKRVFSPVLAEFSWIATGFRAAWAWVCLQGWDGLRWPARFWMLGNRVAAASALFGLVAIWWGWPGLWLGWNG